MRLNLNPILPCREKRVWDKVLLTQDRKVREVTNMSVLKKKKESLKLNICWSHTWSSLSEPPHMFSWRRIFVLYGVLSLLGLLPGSPLWLSLFSTLMGLNFAPFFFCRCSPCWSLWKSGVTTQSWHHSVLKNRQQHLRLHPLPFFFNIALMSLSSSSSLWQMSVSWWGGLWKRISKPESLITSVCRGPCCLQFGSAVRWW